MEECLIKARFTLGVRANVQPKSSIPIGVKVETAPRALQGPFRSQGGQEIFFPNLPQVTNKCYKLALLCTKFKPPLLWFLAYCSSVGVFFTHVAWGPLEELPTTGFWSLAKVFVIFPQSFWVRTKPHLVDRTEKSALNLVRLQTRVQDPGTNEVNQFYWSQGL
jgi:hypothetical protein